MILRHRGLHFWLLLLAAITLALTLVKPTLALRKNVHRYLIIIDVTQSMNARDYYQPGMPPDRLSFVKAAIQRSLPDFPCGSEVGLAIFANRGIHLLFEPLEICDHFGIIDNVISHIDWRMAWAGDSNIARGLYRGIKDTIRLGENTRLAFFTDGEQTVKELHSPPLRKYLGEVAGLIIGVGSLTPSPLPKLDIENNTVVGHWRDDEVGNVLSAVGSHALPKKQSHNNREPEKIPLYLSMLHELKLKQLATMTGLDYHRLQSSDGLSQAMRSKNFSEVQTVKSDIRWILALTALLLVLATWIPKRR